MPRKRNPVGIAAGKLILTIRKERDDSTLDADASAAQQVLNRAQTLLQASQSSSVTSLLDGRSVIEYLNADWVKTHPSVEPSLLALIAALEANERDQ